MEAPRLARRVEARWLAAWGEKAVDAARRQIAKRPPLDLSFADDAEAQAFAEAHGGKSLAPSHVRLPSSAVAELPGFAEGRWWVQDLAASLPARLIPGRRDAMCSICARRPAARRCSSRPRAGGSPAVDASKSRLQRLRENLERTHLDAHLVAADALNWKPDGS